MMRLSNLWNVARTLDSRGRPSPPVQQIVACWDNDQDSLQHVRASANFVWRFEAGGQRRFLRFADGSERSRETIEAEIDLLEWLAGRGAPTIRPIQSRAGRLVETIDTDIGTFHSVVFAEVPGRHLDSAELVPCQFERWGAALGSLHALVTEYHGPTRSNRPSWRDHLVRASTLIPNEQSEIRRELNLLAEALAKLPIDPEGFGLVHGDFELDNLCWPDDSEGPIGILDFDDCSQHWFAADISFALRDLFDRGADLTHPSIEAFVRGYRGNFPLDGELHAALPLFSRLSRLLVYATLVRSLDLPEQSDQPEWLRKLRTKFEAKLFAYAASLTTTGPAGEQAGPIHL
jgi:Ser/Thr protein kinase RdoA (MazF antagonist)